MPIELWQGLLIPFAGTTLGAACVFFMRNNLGEMVQRALTGFAAEETFGPAKVRTVQGIASFVCRKAKEKHP